MNKVPSYSHEPDLIRHFTAGETAAFTTVYREFYFRVYQFARRWLPERQDAEDVTADTFVKLWDRREQFKTLENISAFLHVTARNACYDFLKHSQVKSGKKDELVRQLSAASEADFSFQEIREEFLKLVYAEVEKMPKKMKEIFLLSYAEGLKPAEIAQKLDLIVQTVSNQKTNAINLLRLALGDKPLLLAFLLCLEIPTVWQA